MIQRVAAQSALLQHVGLCGGAGATLLTTLDFLCRLNGWPLIRPDEKLISWMRPGLPSLTSDSEQEVRTASLWA